MLSTPNAKKLSDSGKMIDLETLRSRLSDRNIMAVAKGAGVHPNALYRLMRSGSQPQYDTVRKVVDYLNKQTEASHG
jgi:DNA-binding phage protein